MSFEDVYYIGQNIAVLALIISLVFVGLQVRLANRLARADMSERALSAMGEAPGELMRNPVLAQAFRKAMFGEGTLTPVETTQILSFLSFALNLHRSAYNSVRHGLIDEQIMLDLDHNMVWYLGAPVFQKEWVRLKKLELFSGAYVGHIEGMIAKAAIQPAVNGSPT